ncbi:hypothetical protein BH10CYA1_BH10CYA1_61390 [soil metagenome]
MNAAQAEQPQSPWRSKFLWAAIFLLVVNAALLIVNPFGKVDPGKLPSPHSWEWWRTQSYLSAPKAPDVVLLGSSLVMIPTPMLDADYLNKPFDCVHHDHSIYMQDRLADLLGPKNLSCINFGLPGGMISDDYMVARYLLNNERKPKVVVLGITLRDFIEHHVQYPATSHPYRYFSQFMDVADIVDIAMPQAWQRADYLWGRNFVLWGKRLQMQAIADEVSKKAIAPLQSSQVAVNPVTDAERNKTLAAKLKAIAEEGEFMMEPHKLTLFEDNTSEYRSRFRGDKRELFNAEAAFLSKLLKLLRDRNIEVLVANMPLMPANMSVMPPGMYDEYMSLTKKLVAENNCKFLDLNDPAKFVISDFRDTAHMNGNGGKKFIDSIDMAILQAPTLRAALTKGEQQTSIAGRDSTIH